MTTLTLRDLGFVGLSAPGSSYDADAQAYITAVEAADGQALETAVRDAINTFVVGCKTDGIWSAIKASCILAGARTLTGALVPLVGTAPTNNGFTSSSYNRKTGLVGNGSNYLNSNRANNADGLNDTHMSVYVSAIATAVWMGANQINGSTKSLEGLSERYVITRFYSGDPNFTDYNAFPAPRNGFYGMSRSASASYTVRGCGTNNTVAIASTSQNSIPVMVYGRTLDNSTTPDARTSARFAFYSIGSAIDLALLDSRVTALVNACGAAIP